jgi:hypothetical protein
MYPSRNVSVPVTQIGNLTFDRIGLSIDVTLLEHNLSDCKWIITDEKVVIEVVAFCASLHSEAEHLFVSAEIIKKKVMKGENIKEKKAENVLIAHHIFNRIGFSSGSQRSKQNYPIKIFFSPLVDDQVFFRSRLDFELPKTPRHLGVVPDLQQQTM